MIHHDAAILLIEIKKAMNNGFKATPKDVSVMQNIVARMKYKQGLSEKQSWALQEIYRRSQGHNKKLYTKVI